MDPFQFDCLARILAGSSTRRGSLGLLTSLVTVTGWEHDPASAKKRKRKHRGKGKGKGDKPNDGGATPSGNICAKSGTRTCGLSQPRDGVLWDQCNLKDAGLVGASLAGMQARTCSEPISWARIWPVPASPTRPCAAPGCAACWPGRRSGWRRPLRRRSSRRATLLWPDRTGPRVLLNPVAQRRFSRALPCRVGVLRNCLHRRAI